jgi:EmrB/QacA subfamily drug resistance transporter
VNSVSESGEPIVSEASAGGSSTAPPDIRNSSQRWRVLAILCAGLFMLLLDGTIVNIAIPSILEDFQAGFSEVEWVMNAYLLVFAVLLITSGRLGDLYGRRLLFMTGLTVFTLASLACGLSPGIGWLIGFRALQGLGGAMMMPATLSIIAAVFPPHERGMAMGIWGGVTGIAVAVGPTLGGVIIEVASWPYIFIVNVPVGIVALTLAWKVIPESKDPSSVRQIDYVGVSIISAALFALTFALVEGQNFGWTSPLILGLFAVAAAGLMVFVLVERRQEEPLIQLSLFRSRTFTTANISGLILTFGMMGVFFLLPIFLQAILGYSAIKAGLLMTPLAAVVVFAAPLAGWLSDRIGSRWLISGGMLIAAFGFYLTREAMSLDGGWEPLVVPFMVSGFGIGIVMAPMTSAVMASAPIEKAGSASGILSTMRQLGSVLGIAVMGAVLQNRAVAYIGDAVGARLDPLPLIPADVKAQIVDGATSAVTNMGEMQAAGGSMGEPPAAVKDLLAQASPQALDLLREIFSRDLIMGEFVRAMQTTFLVSMVVLLMGSVVALFIRSHVKDVRESAAMTSEDSAIDGPDAS